MTATLAARESAALARINSATAAFVARHITGGELDSIISECERTLTLVEHDRINAERARVTVRRHFMGMLS